MEKINALTDIPLLVTTRGRLSVRDALLDAHILKKSSDEKMDREPVVLDKTVPGYVYGAQLRLLAAVTAVAVRLSKYTRREPFRIEWEPILSEGIEPEAVDEAIELLAPGSFLFDDQQPFMQRPAEPMRNAKDNERKLGKGELRLKKLLPSMISDQGEEFWSLLTQHDTLSPEDAALSLLSYHYYSPAGNNSYAGQKAEMGSPGFHFVGVGMTATELIWEGPSLLHTLFAMIPRSWVEGEGLPAWVDRTGSRGGTNHPLWQATWSSNSAACYWENNELAGVRIGGVPPG
ncbi:type I-E CRISPR-associated protein Cse1/CasA, partial [Actinotignum sanguinis]